MRKIAEYLDDQIVPFTRESWRPSWVRVIRDDADFEPINAIRTMMKLYPAITGASFIPASKFNWELCDLGDEIWVLVTPEIVHLHVKPRMTFETPFEVDLSELFRG